MTVTYRSPALPPEMLAAEAAMVDEMIAEGDEMPDGITEEALDEIVREVFAEDCGVSAAERQIRDKVRSVRPTRTAHGKWRVKEEAFGVMSTGEKIAVAMVLDRPDLLQSCWGTMLEAIDRLGPDWTIASLRVQRNGWDHPRT